MKNDLTTEGVIRIENLTKKFGDFKAVNGVELSVPKKSIFALVGPNGAGKTTLVKVLVGLLKPESGQVVIFGKNIAGRSLEVKSSLGYISDNPLVYEYLSGREFLYLTGSLRGLERRDIDRRIKQIIDIFPLDQLLDQPMSQYSRGNRQKIAFLAAILAKPKLLIIDEPIVGLDPKSIKILGSELRKFTREGGTVFFVTHILPFAQEYATEAAVMVQGKIVKKKKLKRGVSLENLYQLAT